MTVSNTTAAAENAATNTVDAMQAQTQAFFVDATAWLQSHWLQILIATGIAIGIVLLLHVLRRWGMKLCERSEGPAGWGTIIGRAVSRTGNFFITMIAARLVSSYAAPPEMLGQTIDFLFTVSAVFQAAIWAREIILGAIEKKTEAENYHGEALLSALGLIRLLVTVALFAIALVVVLDNLGVNVTGLVAGLGVGGIAIGLAAQGIFADLFAALAIIFDKPFRRGDKVMYDQTVGVVEEIGLKSTRVRSFDGEVRVISNKQLLDKEIQNISNRDHVRVKLSIGVAYETPPEQLEALPDMLTGIVEEAGGTIARASFEGLGASSVDFFLWFDIPGDDWPTAHKVRDKVIIAILRRFAAEGISIPYPTQTTYTADPSGKLILPYPEVQPVMRVDKGAGER
ncbi:MULTISPECIES: mechanosensitive ion channel family protein [unclassified Sphingomonas]|uniref:mechanosensitive ion channel family protein n=1 Tax=unclassified Sphingomonas TaxID=196159 RepID=UPI002150C3EE|nr:MULTISPECIES: mechanosensitive ion channel family protein [unclassified Sphingomonas]MCR5871605.1 mechanosensitive ion channel family protein [Sphingomonas sp. J344]UUY00102.1 mechanosensitive ion channel family protein [Sphingomonas sp. J315]